MCKCVIYFKGGLKNIDAIAPRGSSSNYIFAGPCGWHSSVATCHLAITKSWHYQKLPYLPLVLRSVSFGWYCSQHSKWDASLFFVGLLQYLQIKATYYSKTPFILLSSVEHIPWYCCWPFLCYSPLVSVDSSVNCSFETPERFLNFQLYFHSFANLYTVICIVLAMRKSNMREMEKEVCQQ